MADFHQHERLTTLHGLHEAFDRDTYLEELESKLVRHARRRKITLLLPCLYSELHNPHVLGPIVDNINDTAYIHSVVVALGKV